MPLITLKCNSCGGDISFDSSKDIGFCPYCGAQYLKETPINNYTMNITNTFKDANVTIENENEGKMLDAGDTLLSLGNYVSAEKKFTEVIEKWPQNYRGWYGAALAQLQDIRRGVEIEYYKNRCETIASNFTNAMTMCNDNNIKQKINNEYTSFISEKNKTISDFYRRRREEEQRYEQEKRRREWEDQRIEREHKQKHEDMVHKRNVVRVGAFFVILIAVTLFISIVSGTIIGGIIFGLIISVILYFVCYPIIEIIALFID